MIQVCVTNLLNSITKYFLEPRQLENTGINNKLYKLYK